MTRRVKSRPIEGMTDDQPESTLSHFNGALKRNLLAGLLVVLPSGVTMYMVYWLWDFVTESLKIAFGKMGYDKVHSALALLVVLAGIYLVGFVARSLIGRSVINLGEAIVQRVPVVGTLYGGLKQILETVFSGQSNAFQQAVLIEYPRRGIWTIGFITNDVPPVMVGQIEKIEEESERTADPAGSDASEDKRVYVFVPTTPNPTSGFLIMVPRSEILELQITVDEAVKLIISGGIISPFKGENAGDNAPPPVSPVVEQM